LIFDIRHYTIHDGPGIRTTVFFKGCPLRCCWCHNPESQEGVVEEVSLERKLEGKVFKSKVAVGSWQSVEEVMSEIEKDVIFYQESGGGVTFSGGEPLMQSEFLSELLASCRDKGIHTAVDTSGYAEPAAVQRVMDLADLWLFDLKLLDDNDHVVYTGVSNELVLKNLKTLARSGKDIVVRFPVVPGMTDKEENLNTVAQMMKELELNRISLLPYHAIAKDKYKRLGREYLMEGVSEPSLERIRELKRIFEEQGIVGISSE